MKDRSSISILLTAKMGHGKAKVYASSFEEFGSSPARFSGLLVAKRRGWDYRGRGHGTNQDLVAADRVPISSYYPLFSDSPGSIPCTPDTIGSSSVGSSNPPSEGVILDYYRRHSRGTRLWDWSSRCSPYKLHYRLSTKWTVIR